MLYLKLVIVYLLLLQLLEAADDKTECVKELRRKSSFTAQRFTQGQLEATCRKNDYWKNATQQLKPAKVRTPAQEEYVQYVRQCKGRSCLAPKETGKGKGTDKSQRKHQGDSNQQGGQEKENGVLNSEEDRRDDKEGCEETSSTKVGGGYKATTRVPHSSTSPHRTRRDTLKTTKHQRTTITSTTVHSVSPETTPPATTAVMGSTATVASTNSSTIGMTTKAPESTTIQTTVQQTTAQSSPSTAGTPGSTVSTVTPSPTSKVIRKEYRNMTDLERQKFHAAVNKLKSDIIDGESKYNLLVQDHLPSMAPEAHWGCAFLPYHREFLKQMEVGLRLEDPDVFLPYWDSTLDQGLPSPCDSVLWSATFMGNARGRVTTGPFANWAATQPAPGQNGNQLYRNCGISSDGELYRPGDVDHFMTYTSFEQHSYCVDPTFEIDHGLVHDFVGGHMSYIPLSPNDPVFFLHHAFIDCLWEEWRLAKQTRQQRVSDYCPDADACGPDYLRNAPMKPFVGLQNVDGLSNNYTDQLYNYSRRPSCPNDCPGPYLFCNNANPPRCLAKINVGGNCTGLSSLNACYNGNCVNNQCVGTVG